MPGHSNRDPRGHLGGAGRCGDDGRAPTTFPTIWNGEKDLSRGGELAGTHRGPDRLLGGRAPADEAGLAVGPGAPGAPARSDARPGPRPDGGSPRELGGESIAAMERTRVLPDGGAPGRTAPRPRAMPRPGGPVSRWSRSERKTLPPDRTASPLAARPGDARLSR